MNIASERLSLKSGFIISTDADTLADRKWLFHLKAYLKTDVSLVCGLINSSSEGLNKQAAAYLKAKDEYLLLKAKLESKLLPDHNNPWPRHSYQWGPNLAIKNNVYNAIGGIRPLHFLEDEDLYYKVLSQGYLVRHCMDCKVVTSSRTDSRCNEDFGAELRIWTDYEAVAYNLEGLAKLKLRYSIYNLIKLLYKLNVKDNIKAISEMASMQLNQVEDLFETCKRHERMRVAIEQALTHNIAWNELHPNESVFSACKSLKKYFEESSNKIS